MEKERIKTDLDEVKEIRHQRYLKRNKENQKMNLVKLKEKQDFVNLLNLIDQEIKQIEGDATDKDKWLDWYAAMLSVKFAAQSAKRKI